ncbi:MAG: hypothetical protein AB1571_04140 [Nanoarchaeota archaeon]
MLNTHKNKNVIPLKPLKKYSKEVDTRQITSLMNTILDKKSENNVDNEILKNTREKLDSIIESFNTTYKELVTIEIKTMNLNIAADAIKSRDDLVDRIYDTVIEEINHQICK